MSLQHFADPSIQCPHCQQVIKLTESLAQPLLAQEKNRANQQIQMMQEKVKLVQQEMLKEKKSVEDERQTLRKNYEQVLSQKINEETQKINEEAKRKAEEIYQTKLYEQAQTIKHLEEVKEKTREQLQKAQAVELEIMKKEEALREKEAALELDIQRRLAQETQKAREMLEVQLQERFEQQNQMMLQQNQRILQQKEEQFKLDQSQKELVISGLKNTIEDLNKKAQQGSQQLQGEAFEIELEKNLSERFQQDHIQAVAKGVNGADLLQTVYDFSQKAAGKMIWELKNTKTWKAEWLSKLRQDQRQAGADIAILLSYTLPFKNETFEMIDGVWVAHPRFAIPLAMILRDSLLQIQKNQQVQQGIQQKSELVYAYLNSAGFRQRLEAIVEAFTTMKEDLDKEKKVILKQWEKRNKQIEQVIGSTIGMYGDLQGIAGRDIQTIAALEFDTLDTLDELDPLNKLDAPDKLDDKQNQAIQQLSLNSTLSLD
jgi:hypothetical protein